MAVPLPESVLTGPCSIIHNNTLYVYTPESFQSIRLVEGEKWAKLPMGISATGAACVYAVPKQDAAQPLLYVVGGITNKTDQEYSGLQSYNFNENKWVSVPMQNKPAANRTNHAATYLKDSSMLFIFSGSQKGPDDKVPSMETYVLDTTQQFRSLALDKGPSTRIAPQLLNWNTSHAALVGGSDSKDIFLFHPDQQQKDKQWGKLDVTLPNSIPDQNKVKAALITGADGSKVLETFDLSVTPNVVGRVVLQEADGKPPASGRTVGDPTHRRRHRRSSSPPPAKRRRRDLTVASWPTYNSSLASSSSRADFAIAQNDKGLVVLSGGDEKAPLILFDSETNSWLNATEFFSGKVSVQSISTTSSATSTSATSNPTISLTASSTSTPPSSSDAAAAAAAKSSSLKILGGALGGVFGLAVLLGILLLLLRWCRHRRAHASAGHLRRSSGLPDDRLSFADRGISFNSDAAPFRQHAYKTSNTSVAIMNGRIDPPQKRGLFSKGRASNGSSSSLFSRVRGRSPMGNDMQMQEKPAGAIAFAPSPVPSGTRSTTKDGSGKQRSSGWSRYWSGQSTTNLASMTPGGSGEKREHRGSDDSQLHLATSGAPQPTLKRSPSEHTLKAQHEHSYTNPRPTLTRASTTASTVSTVSRDDAFSSGVPASVTEQTTWTPMAGQNWNHGHSSGGVPRAPSSIYTESVRGSTILRDDSVPRDSSLTTFPGSGSYPSVQQQALSRPEGTKLPPRDIHRNEYGAAAHTDMSWLNLGAQR
ncbi:MAG: hypothetical protein M1814_002791 [Vezdaea aestivalis]|nr:MAG: hypothetical protein M1814_002791 [Vezdaea aestivalis]